METSQTEIEEAEHLLTQLSNDYNSAIETNHSSDELKTIIQRCNLTFGLIIVNSPWNKNSTITLTSEDQDKHEAYNQIMSEAWKIFETLNSQFLYRLLAKARYFVEAKLPYDDCNKAIEDIFIFSKSKLLRYYSFREDKSFQGFFQRIVRNETINYIRDNSRHSKNALSVDDQMSDNGSDFADKQILIQQVQAKIDLLTDKQKELLTLILAGHSKEEIRSILKLSESNFQKRRKRAVIELQNLLAYRQSD